MKVGVITDGISQDIEHALRVMLKYDLRYAELQSVWNTEVGELSDDRVADVAAVLKRHGVRASCISRHILGGLPLNTTRAGDENHRRHLDALARCIAMAQRLECRIVRLMSGRREPVITGRNGAEHWMMGYDSWSGLLSLVEPAVRIAEREDVTLVVETGMSGMVFSAAIGRRLVEDIGSPNLKVLWDPSNCLHSHENAYPDGYELLRGSFLGHVHVKDVVMDTTRGEVTCCPLGEGQIGGDWQLIAAALKRDGYDGGVSLESVYRPPNGSDEDGFRASIARFSAAFG